MYTINDKHVIDMVNATMFIIIMLSLVYNALMTFVYPSAVKRITQSNMSVLDLCILLFRWCIERILNRIKFCSKNTLYYLFSMYNTCSFIKMLEIMLNMPCNINEYLSMSSKESMETLYHQLNKARCRARNCRTMISDFNHTSPQNFYHKKYFFFENFLKICSFILLTTSTQNLEHVDSIIKILVVIQKRVHRAKKTTWLCLCYELNRSVSGSRLVINPYPFQCVSPYFRPEDINTDVKIKKYMFLNIFNRTLTSIVKSIYRMKQLPLYTLVSNIIIIFSTRHMIANVLFVNAFIMIKIYIYPNG